MGRKRTKSEEYAMDDFLISRTRGQKQQHCGQPAERIGNGRQECSGCDSVFGIDYDTGRIGWQER
ncbi:hypothetical protein [Streptomyces sp. NPDC059786]|uniref:hypothetical protein n=1 Tax=Streptomyces sp. NPDC059786 TaxID=3346946 RepID=UPI003651C9F9